MKNFFTKEMFDAVVKGNIKRANEIGDSIMIRWDEYRGVWVSNCTLAGGPKKTLFATVYADGRVEKGAAYHDFDLWIIIDDGNTFEGDLLQFQDCFFSNANKEMILDWISKEMRGSKVEFCSRPDNHHIGKI